MKWISSKNKIPPLYKKIVICNAKGKMRVASLEYDLKMKDGLGYECDTSLKDFKTNPFFWIVLPEVDEKKLLNE